MYKYVKFDENSGLCTEVGTGTNTEFYKSIGMARKDVEQSEVDGQWYLTAKCPHYTDEEKLNNAKTAKLNELNTIASQYDSYKCNDMYITSSVGGYRFNADIRSQTNLQGLISGLDDVKTVAYKDYDNEFQSLTKEQMQTIFSECILNSQNLYKQKWDYADKIKACKTVEELEKIDFNFVMLDLSPKVEKEEPKEGVIDDVSA